MIDTIDTEKQEVVVMTPDELTSLMKRTVTNTLVQMGLKSNSLSSGKIYRTDMVKVIGRWKFDEAVREGRLYVHKDKDARNSKVWARRSDWERFLKHWTNQKL